MSLANFITRVSYLNPQSSRFLNYKMESIAVRQIVFKDQVKYETLSTVHGIL